MKIEIVGGESEDSEEKEYGKFDKYEIECAVDTLLRAEEIKADAEKMAYIKPLLEKKVSSMKKTISSISELKAVRQKKAEEADME